MYMRAYASTTGDSFKLIEKFVQVHKCHRSILDQDDGHLVSQTKKIEELQKRINELRAEERTVERIKREKEEVKAKGEAAAASGMEIESGEE